MKAGMTVPVAKDTYCQALKVQTLGELRMRGTAIIDGLGLLY